MQRSLHNVKSIPIKKVAVYKVNHPSFMDEAIYGNADLINFATFKYGRRMSFGEAYAVLEKDNYEIKGCIINCLI